MEFEIIINNNNFSDFVNGLNERNLAWDILGGDEEECVVGVTAYTDEQAGFVESFI